MEETFYCGRCGRFRLISERCSSPAGIRPVCIHCRNKAINNLKRSEKSRDARRAKSVGKIEHLIPKEVD